MTEVPMTEEERVGAMAEAFARTPPSGTDLRDFTEDNWQAIADLFAAVAGVRKDG